MIALGRKHNLTNDKNIPSPNQIQRAFTALAAARSRLLELDPGMPQEDPKLWQDMLEGEAQGDPYATLDKLIGGALETKAHVEGLRLYRQTLSERLVRLEAREDRLRGIAQRMLEQLDIETLVRPAYTARISEGRVKVVPNKDAKDMPERFQRVTIEVDKEALAAALKAGEDNVPAHWSNAEPVLNLRTR